MHSPWRTFLIAALATIAALAAIGVSSALAAPKEIAYACNGSDICLLDPNNPSAVTNLTDDGTTSFDEEPVWSPDGKRLAFVARFTAKNEENIYTMEPDAPGDSINLAVQVTHFTNGQVPTGELAWSPDGSKIAFVRGIANPGAQPLYVTNSDGSLQNAVPLATEGGRPTWAPDSAKVAYYHSNQVYLRNADASGVATPLQNAAGVEPSWSPDGGKIAFGLPISLTRRDLRIVSSTGTGSAVEAPANTQFISPVWSSSGDRVAYRATTPPTPNEVDYIRVVNADGSGGHGLPIVQGLTVGGLPSWAPDGSRLVFSGWQFGGDQSHEVYIANADGSGSVSPITGNQGFETEPAWRPNPAAAPQIFTPSGGSSGPLPGPTQKPKTIWFTKRIPWTPGPDLTLIVLSVGCGGPVCNAGGQGTSKGSVAAGIRPRPGLAATSAKAKPKKSRKIVVGKLVKTTIRRGQTRPVKMKLTAAGVKLLTQLGKLAIDIELTIATPGQPTVVEHHKVNVFVEKAKRQHKHKH